MASLRGTVREFNVYRWAGRMLTDAGRWRLKARVDARRARFRNGERGDCENEFATATGPAPALGPQGQAALGDAGGVRRRCSRSTSTARWRRSGPGPSDVHVLGDDRASASTGSRAAPGGHRHRPPDLRRARAARLRADLDIGNHGAEDDSDPRLRAAGLPGARPVARALAGARGRPGRRRASRSRTRRQSLALHFRTAPDRATPSALIEDVLAGFTATAARVRRQAGLQRGGRRRARQGRGGAAPARASRRHGAFFAGDDVNDEPVFAVAQPAWVTVRVGGDDPDSRAMYYLSDVDDVASMLDQMIARLGDDGIEPPSG